MRKIPTAYVRDETDRSRVTSQITPGCEWIFGDEAVARRKYDGTCVLIEDGRMFKRRTVKADQPIPWGYLEADFDRTTGKSFGWVPVGDSDRIYLDARHVFGVGDGTYELCGPKVQGNPEGFDEHVLVKHDSTEILHPPRSFTGLRDFLIGLAPWEGIVWWRTVNDPVGCVPGAKLKRRDFGG